MIKSLILEDPSVEIHVLAHSMGGLVTGYWLATHHDEEYPTGSNKRLREYVKSIVLFDSAPNGFTDWALGHWTPSPISAGCSVNPPHDSPKDITDDGGPVLSAVQGLGRAAGMPKVFALDAYPGQAGSFGGGAGPCDAVPTRTGAVENMRIGHLPIVSGEPFKVWAKTHGGVWADGWENAAQARETDNGLEGSSLWSYVRGASHYRVAVANVNGLTNGAPVLLRCESNTVQIADYATSQLDLLEAVGDATGWVTRRLSDSAENIGLGNRERSKVRDIIGCAISGDTVCPITTTYAVSPGTTITTQVPISTDAADLRIGVYLPQSTGLSALAVAGSLDVTLRSPNDAIVSPTATGAEFLSFSIPDPEAGNWRIELDGAGATSASDVSISIAIAIDSALDLDQDNVLDSVDNCPSSANGSQLDLDNDGTGDACDPDIDGDLALNGVDNCALEANTDQFNADAGNAALNLPGADALGDACDDDIDGDGYSNDQEATAPLAEDPLVYCDIMRADGDGDHAVTILDLTLLAGQFLNQIPPAPERYNQDADNAITILDLTKMANLFLDNVSACA